jgi:hypothetical protein
MACREIVNPHLFFDNSNTAYFKIRSGGIFMEELRTDFVERQSKLKLGKEHNKLLTTAESPVPTVYLLHDSTVSTPTPRRHVMMVI